MERIETITYKGNCPRCGKEQNNKDPTKVDIDCWDCSVNATLERHDIMRDIEKEIQKSNGIALQLNKPGLKKALEIIKKYDA